jgi:hypothetical protein
MARWKEPIAKLANAEMQRKGHFYEQRFGSREILDDAANLCCNVYVDLNQLRAGMATSLEECHYSAIQDRLRAWRRLEAEESVDHFQSKAHSEEYALTTTEMEQLLEDCFLAPIGDQGPPILLGGADKPGMQGPVTVTTGDESEQAAVEEAAADLPPDNRSASHDTPPAAPAGLDSSSATAVPVPESGPDQQSDQQRDQPHRRAQRRTTKSGTKPTRRIHERLQRRRRPRASDNQYLGIPRTQYRELVQWTAEQLHGNAPQPPPDTWDALLKKWGLNPAHWCQVVQQFGELFFRAVGHVDHMAQLAQRSGCQTLHGSQACGDAFT